MAGFKARASVDLDDQERLLATVVEWTQAVPGEEGGLFNLLVLSMGVTAYSSFVANIDPPNADTATMVAIGAVGFAVLMIVCLVWFCREPKELWFHYDGRITMPQGQPGGWWAGKTVNGDLHNIVTVRAQQVETRGNTEESGPKEFEVWFYFDDGSSVIVAEHLLQYQAHHVTVLLTQALHDMRDALANDIEASADALGFAVVE